MGQIGTALAMREVIGKAAKTGIVAGAIRGSNHCGTMVYFARMALPHDTIGIATTNADDGTLGRCRADLRYQSDRDVRTSGEDGSHRVRRRIQRVLPFVFPFRCSNQIAR